MIICGQKEFVGNWVAERIGNARPWNDYEAVGILSNGKLVGGGVIDNYIPNARCSLHIAGEGKRWLNREFFYMLADYIFRQLNCNVIVNIVDSTNMASMKFTEHAGFKIVHVIKGGGKDGSDGVVFEMQKDDCKWHRPKEKTK